MRSSLYFLYVCSALASVSTAAEWKQFRGPDGQGHTNSKELPLKWSETENVHWKTPIPGRGWSSPVFDGDVVWMTTAVEDPLTGEALEKVQKNKQGDDPASKEVSLLSSVSLRAISVDVKTGNLLSDIELLNVATPPVIHTLNSYASPTPVLDGNLLLCHFGELGTACLDTYSGKVKWTKVLPSSHAVGAGSSPVIFGDLVICPCDGTDVQYVAALNKQTGELVWKTNRPKMSGQNGDFHKSYCTPLLVEVAGKNQVIIPGAQWVVAYDPVDGREIWRVRYGDGFSNVPRPVIANDLVCVCTGFMQPQLIGIRMDGEGDVTSSHVAWKIPKSVPTMPSPIVVGEEIYFITDQGVATCANAAKGATVWTKRLGGNYSASPLASEGRIYFSNREGETTVIQPGKKYEELASNKLDGQHMASPAVFENSLLLRTNTHLYRIGQ
ncbi:MAG: serine/threonine protein kinase afsK [Schlesneria sp.]|nr:serine/threonine protein kinase afsK [Schlesneria sp.]